MNWPALWKEAGIDPEGKKATVIKNLIDDSETFLSDFKEQDIISGIEKIVGLSLPRIQEILRSE
jgi:hypothetical protein